MTEDEAKTKWCPHFRVTGASSGLDIEWMTNRDDDGPDDLQFMNCIGSACMAWRARKRNTTYTTRAENQLERRNFETQGFVLHHTYEKDGIEFAVYEKRSDEYGYCGLAGSPA